MEADKSTLKNPAPRIPESPETPLKTEVSELTTMNKIFKGKSFSKEEKEKWWNQTNKKYKIGEIRAKELDKQITIFTESFDFSKKRKGSTPTADEVKAKNPVSASPESLVTAALLKYEEGLGSPNTNPDVKDDIEPKQELSFEEDDAKLKEEDAHVIGTSSDFERLYLGWLKGPEKYNMIKSLFRFVFGTKTISETTATHLQKKYRIAYTNLNIKDKIPCQTNDGLWEDFKKSLEFRRDILMKEIFAARDLIGENNLYMEQKKRLALGILDVIYFLERKSNCMIYGFDASQNLDETDAEYLRLLRVFRNFVRDKKNNNIQSYEFLKKELLKSSDTKGPETSQKLYEDLLKLLEWMEEDKVDEISKQLETLRMESNRKNQNIKELDDYIRYLLVIIVHLDSINSFNIALHEVKDVLQKSSIQKLIDSRKKEIDEVVASFQNKDTTPKMKEMNELVMALASFIVSNDTVTNIERGISDIRDKLNKINGSDEFKLIKPKVEELLNSITLRAQKGGSKDERLRVNARINILNPSTNTRTYTENNSEKKESTEFCETLLTAFLLKRNSPGFLARVKATLSDLGQRDLVLEALRKIVDESMNKSVKENGYVFSSVDTNQEFSKKLEDVYTKNFDKEDKEYFKDIFPGTYKSETPAQFQDILGTRPYFLLGESENNLYGIDGVEDDDPVVLEEEEREAIMGGIPLGAILVLYAACLTNYSEDEIRKSNA